ncbi:hypothetical protein [Streptomyces sp. NPDC087294]|uniref:hypothetical protein n=1 Tax=Streptomyces sp. NPDC087294 TaxID=3365777 RepID=UPI0037F64D65
MDGQGCGDHLNSSREVNGFELWISVAKSKADAANIREWYDLSEADFVTNFPHLAKGIQELPDNTDDDPPPLSGPSEG